jgi:hypothetical protein
MIGFTLTQELDALRAYHHKWIKGIYHLIHHLPKDISTIHTKSTTCFISKWIDSKGYIFQKIDSTQYIIEHIIEVHREIHTITNMILGLYTKYKELKWYQKRKKKKILLDIENHFKNLLDKSQLLLELFDTLEKQVKGLTYRELINAIEEEKS